MMMSAPARAGDTARAADADSPMDTEREVEAPSGSPLRIRRAARDDRAALAAMMSRCSDDTRFGRFHGYLPSFPEPYLTDALSGRAGHLALVAEAQGAIVALASCCTLSPDAGEIAIVVEDAWQRLGIGTRLLAMLLEHADRNGMGIVKASVHAERGWVLRMLRGYGPCSAWVSSGVYDVTMRREAGRREEEDTVDYSELRHRFAELTTAHLADACIRAQLPVRCAPALVRAVVPGSRLAGRVSPARHAGSVDVFLEAFENSAPGDVLVVDNGGRTDESCVGDLVVLEAKAAGLAGVVIWGLHRDTADIRAIGLPVFSLGAIPTGPLRLGSRPEGALESATAGDWTVSRADLVLADDDGVLFVPAARAGEVFTLAEKIRDTERRQAEQIRAGVSLRSQLQFGSYLARRQQTPSLTFREHLRTVGGAIEV
jgi:regulator of RNase E activity RraA/ribosomal protein S18 acetylase RimI-like enzyme